MPAMLSIQFYRRNSIELFQMYADWSKISQLKLIEAARGDKLKIVFISPENNLFVDEYSSNLHLSYFSPSLAKRVFE